MVVAGAAIALMALVASRLISEAGPYQDAPPPSGQLHPELWPGRTLTIADLGHSTLLMNWYGLRVLSDPTLFNRVGLSLGSLLTIGPRRHSAPPLAPAQLQNLDVILITHAHMDHLDLPSLRALPKSAVVIACGGCAAADSSVGLHRRARASMGRADGSKRTQRDGDGREALGRAMAADGPRVRLQQLPAGARRHADAARVRQRLDAAVRGRSPPTRPTSRPSL